MIGSVKGKFAAFQAKVDKIHSQYGPFALVVCVGDFFGPSDADREPLPTPSVPVYVISAGFGVPADTCRDSERNNGQIAENLVYLGAWLPLLTYSKEA